MTLNFGRFGAETQSQLENAEAESTRLQAAGNLAHNPTTLRKPRLETLHPEHERNKLPVPAAR